MMARRSKRLATKRRLNLKTNKRKYQGVKPVNKFVTEDSAIPELLSEFHLLPTVEVKSSPRPTIIYKVRDIVREVYIEREIIDLQVRNIRPNYLVVDSLPESEGSGEISPAPSSESPELTPAEGKGSGRKKCRGNYIKRRQYKRQLKALVRYARKNERILMVRLNPVFRIILIMM